MTDTVTDEATIRFGPLDVVHDGGVLAPRPWTLAQSAWAADLLADLPPGPVLELCSGVGHIGQAAAAMTGRRVVQLEASERACELARMNAATAGVDADVRHLDLREDVDLGERFPLVLADPPYVPSSAVDRFPNDPRPAIDGGTDGLDLARRCAAVAADHLDPGGLLLTQLWSPDQAARFCGELDAGSTLRGVEIRPVDTFGVLVLARAGSGS